MTLTAAPRKMRVSSPRKPAPRRVVPVNTRTVDVRAAGLRRRLLEVSKEQYMRLGFNAVTMDEIAAATGISKKTLYQHFPSKESLLQAVAQESVESCNAQLRAILLDASTAPVVRLRCMMDYVAAMYSEMSVALVHDMQRSAPEIWQRIEAGRQRLITEDFSALLREGKTRGDFRKDVDTQIFLLIYAEVVRHVLNPSTFARLKIAPSRVFESVCKVLFEGLLTEKARKEYHAST